MKNSFKAYAENALLKAWGVLAGLLCRKQGQLHPLEPLHQPGARLRREGGIGPSPLHHHQREARAVQRQGSGAAARI